MKKLLKNWKTTVSGLLFILPVIFPALAPHKDLIVAGAGALLGTAAKDATDKDTGHE